MSRGRKVEPVSEKAVMRSRDFLVSLVLIALSLFFLWRTSLLPFLDKSENGVRIGDWYNSAALVPFGLFTSLLLISLVLLFIAVKEGGAKITVERLGLEPSEIMRVLSLAVIVFFYIFALVPRVDFILSSALIILAMVFGFHRATQWRQVVSLTVVSASGLYSLIMRFPQSEWGKYHDDDLVTLVCWLVLCGFTLVIAAKEKWAEKGLAIAPVLSFIVPLFLVCSMAFGFKQNVPNRSGLLFSKIEIFYYVSWLPAWRA